MSDGTLFGLIHDLKDRTRAKRFREAQANYVNNPSEETLKALRALDYEATTKMMHDDNVVESQDQTIATNDRDRYFTAIRGVGQGLARVRDAEGDVMGTFDNMTPLFKGGFGMDDEEIAGWRAAIEQDPTVIDQLATFTTPPTKPQDAMNVGPGTAIFDPNTGKVVFRNPSLPRTVKMKGPDGNEQLFVVDENGDFIGGGQGQGPGEVAGPEAGGPVQQLGMDPQARGMRNGNPGNIKDGPWARRQPGYIGSDGTFARFESIEAGNAAQEKLLRDNYVNGRRNVTQIVDKYLGFTGPGGENSQESRDNYIRYVMGRLGMQADQPVPPEALPQLAQAMREFENGTTQGGVAAGQPIARTTGDSGWRQLSDQEAAERGLPADTKWQVGISGTNKGKVVPITGTAPPKTAAKKAKDGSPQLTVAAHLSTVNQLKKIRDEARSLRNDPAFEQATGSIQGALPSIFPSTREFDNRLGAFVSNTVVNTLLKMKKESPNGATGFGQLNKTEGEWIRESAGTFKQTSPKALRNVLQTHERDAMVSIGLAYGVPPKATMMLLQNPDTAAQFDAKFGKGLSKIIMGN